MMTGGSDVLGQHELRLRDLALDLLEGHVDVDLELELQRDHRGALARDRRDLLDAFDEVTGVLDDVDDLGFHDFR